jgi:hypothetical protein
MMESSIFCSGRHESGLPSNTSGVDRDEFWGCKFVYDECLYMVSAVERNVDDAETRWRCEKLSSKEGSPPTVQLCREELWPLIELSR